MIITPGFVIDSNYKSLTEAEKAKINALPRRSHRIAEAQGNPRNVERKASLLYMPQSEEELERSRSLQARIFDFYAKRAETADTSDGERSTNSSRASDELYPAKIG